MVKVVHTKELKLEYPCKWTYKCITEHGNVIEQIVAGVLDTREHTIQKSQESKKGKYCSYSVEVLVHNDDDRKSIFESFKTHKAIKFVL